MVKAKVTLLIDGDGVAFKAACANQETIDWGDDDGVSVNANMKGVVDHMVAALDSYRDTLKADRMIVCLGNTTNWRKELWPEYKAHRKDKERPVLLADCYQFLRENYETESWPRLEADDVMGILSSTIRGSIIVSIDKDMKSTPCRLYNPNRPEDGVVIIDDVMAHETHMTQTLTGDAADGYKGCPGIGPKKAAKILCEAFAVVDPIQNYSIWRKELWTAVVNMFEAKGVNADDALMNARLAYILRNPNEYNRKTSKLKLWQPPI